MKVCERQGKRGTHLDNGLGCIPICTSAARPQHMRKADLTGETSRRSLPSEELVNYETCPQIGRREMRDKEDVSQQKPISGSCMGKRSTDQSLRRPHLLIQIKNIHALFMSVEKRWDSDIFILATKGLITEANLRFRRWYSCLVLLAILTQTGIRLHTYLHCTKTGTIKEHSPKTSIPSRLYEVGYNVTGDLEHRQDKL